MKTWQKKIQLHIFHLVSIPNTPSSSSFHTAYRGSQGRTVSCSTLWSRPSQDPTRPSAHHSSWRGKVRSGFLKNNPCFTMIKLFEIKERSNYESECAGVV